jgi:hypothetical protein
MTSFVLLSGVLVAIFRLLWAKLFGKPFVLETSTIVYALWVIPITVIAASHSGWFMPLVVYLCGLISIEESHHILGDILGMSRQTSWFLFLKKLCALSIMLAVVYGAITFEYMQSRWK